MGSMVPPGFIVMNGQLWPDPAIEERKRAEIRKGLYEKEQANPTTPSLLDWLGITDLLNSARRPDEAPLQGPQLRTDRPASPVAAPALPSFADVLGGSSSSARGAGYRDVAAGASTNVGQPVAASTRSTMRALRLPDGKVVFTNRPELGGEEIGIRDAGRIVRGHDFASPPPTSIPPGPMSMEPGAEKTYGPVPTPSTSAAMGLVRAATEAARARGEGTVPDIRGEMVKGPLPFSEEADPKGSGVSMIEGTPEQQMDIRLERQQAAMELANMLQQEKLALMRPAARAMLENPDIQSSAYNLQSLLPRIQQRQGEVAGKIMALTTPGSPTFIEDPKQRDAAVRQLEDQAKAERDVLLSIMGLRPPLD